MSVRDMYLPLPQAWPLFSLYNWILEGRGKAGMSRTSWHPLAAHPPGACVRARGTDE